MSYELNKSLKHWLVSGNDALEIPGYDLLTLSFGIPAMGLVFRAMWGNEAMSLLEITSLAALIGLTAFFSYQAHTAPKLPQA